MSTYTNAGVTYDASTGLPISFDEGYAGPTDVDTYSIPQEIKWNDRSDINFDAELVKVDGVKLYYSPSGIVELRSSEADNAVLWRNGQWTETGNRDIPFATQIALRNDINLDVVEAFKNAGGNANGNILPLFLTDTSSGANTTLSDQDLQDLGLGGAGIGTDGSIAWLQEQEETDAEAGKKEADKLATQSLEDTITQDYRGLHSTDRFLQRLSLKNLKYPIDADYGNTQDYIQINQFTYQATSPEILFGGDTPVKKFGETLEKGLKMQTQKEKPVGLVKLPMPNDLTDSNNVAWGEDQLNAITAAAATLSAGGVDAGLKLLEDIANKDKGLAQAIGSLLTGSFGGIKGIIEEVKGAVNSDNNDAQLLGRSVVGSGLLNLAGFGLSPEAILARGAGIIPNSNLQLLFNAPTLTAFRFNWKMSPRSQEEAIRINNIIRFFKQGMAVKKKKNSGSGGASYFLATPNIFDITFKTSKTNREITNTNNSVLRMKTCACVGAAVNYTPQGMWNAYEKGQPTSCILSLQFKELEPVYNTDYEEDPFAYPNLTGFVPENAVGY